MQEIPKGDVLFVGTGGGNDVFSTLLAAAALRRQGKKWGRAAIAGVISPFHRHTVEPTDVRGAFRTRPDSARFLRRKGDERQIGFIDAHVADLVEAKQPYHIEEVYALTLERGSVGLAETFVALQERFAEIILVDVGGDILYDGHAPRILSPMFDAMCLRAFVDAGAPGVLCEFGPGTDGEMSPEALMSAFVRCNAYENTFPLESGVIDWWEALYRKWIEPHRKGRTVPMTIEATRSTEKAITKEYRARAHIGDGRWYASYPQRIEIELCKKAYVIDPVDIRNRFAVRCDDPIDWFLQTQVAIERTNNEANLEYWRDADGHLTQLLTPSPLFMPEVRDEIVQYGLDDLANGACDYAFLFPEEWARVPPSTKTRFVADDEGPLVTVLPKRT